MADTDDSSSNSQQAFGHLVEERDKAREVKNRIHRETASVVRWKNVVTGGLLCTAIAVVVTTFVFSKQEETKLFETAFDQVSRTLNDAAIKQQKTMIDGYTSLAKITAGLVATANQTWPLIRPPKWELYAADTRKETGV